MKLTEFEFKNRKYLHSPDTRSWYSWTGEQENGLYLIPKTRLYEIPNALLLTLPDIFAGYRNAFGTAYNRGNSACIWSSSQYASTLAWNRNLNYSNAQVGRSLSDKAYGFSAILERKEQYNE